VKRVRICIEQVPIGQLSKNVKAETSRLDGLKPIFRLAISSDVPVSDVQDISSLSRQNNNRVLNRGNDSVIRSFWSPVNQFTWLHKLPIILGTQNEPSWAMPAVLSNQSGRFGVGNVLAVYQNPRTFTVPENLSTKRSSIGLFASMLNHLFRLLPGSLDFFKLSLNRFQSADSNNDTTDANDEQSEVREVFSRKQAREIALRVSCGPILLAAGIFLIYHYNLRSWRFWLGIGLVSSGLGAFFLPVYWQDDQQNSHEHQWLHGIKIVAQKHLTASNYCATVIAVGRLNPMANVLNTDKQIAVIGALAEGSSIRSIERITGVHRDTIMRLGVKVGKGCTALMDAKMRDLSCARLEMDEIWAFVGKKDRNLRPDDRAVGSVWTFCAIDAETKLVPAFKVGGRDTATANAFVQDVASRMKNRVQISTDGLRAYVEAIEKSFGADVDFAQIVKTYGREEEVSDNRRYSAPEFVSSEKKVITGSPDERLISTSYVERLNATTRLHMRRLTLLTLAFSKKRENFEAAVGLHFAYYNFVKRHNTLRCTPAMAAGVEREFWTVGNLVEAATS
jgi:IS1 family transposase